MDFTLSASCPILCDAHEHRQDFIKRPPVPTAVTFYLHPELSSPARWALHFLAFLALLKFQLCKELLIVCGQDSLRKAAPLLRL